MRPPARCCGLPSSSYSMRLADRERDLVLLLGGVMDSLEVPPLSGTASSFHPSGGGAYVMRRPTQWNWDESLWPRGSIIGMTSPSLLEKVTRVAPKVPNLLLKPRLRVR